MEPKDVDSGGVPPTPSFLVKLFRGDVPLVITYWVFGVLIGNVGFQVAEIFISSNYFQITSTTAGAKLLLGFYWLVIAYSVFTFIAIWRSAGKYKGTRSWGSLARIFVVIGSLGMLGSMLTGLQQGSNTDETLSAELAMLNTSLPSMVDDETRLDSVELIGRDLYYNYTLVEWNVDDLDVAGFADSMTSLLKDNPCADEGAESLLMEDRNMVYVYHDKDQAQVAKISVNRSDCSQ